MTVLHFETEEQVYKFLRSPKRKRNPGYIYVVYAPYSGLFKIGQTRNLDQRKRSFETSVPGSIELVHWFPTDDMDGAEAYYHMLFRAKHTNGEWFRLSPAEDDLHLLQS